VAGRVWRVVAVVLLFSALGCQAMSDFTELAGSMGNLEREVEAEIGGDVHLGWSICNNLVTVNVVFHQLPEGRIELADFKQKVTQVIEANVGRSIGKVVITM